MGGYVAVRRVIQPGFGIVPNSDAIAVDYATAMASGETRMVGVAAVNVVVRNMAVGVGSGRRVL